MRNYTIPIIFQEKISPFLSKIEKIAVIGGNTMDPEIQILIRNGKNEVDCYGIESGLIQLDLNLPYKNGKTYDLVVCSQVLEHIYDVKQGLENIVNLTAKGGLIWIGCPASNRSHGSPYYFAAGYQPELIINLLNLFATKVLSQGVIGSKRLYFMTHALRIWPSYIELKRPVLKYDFTRRKENILLKIVRYIYDLPSRIYSCMLPYKIIESVEFGTETWVLAQKIN
jgi:SAM-dependent methyltransferase